MKTLLAVLMISIGTCAVAADSSPLEELSLAFDREKGKIYALYVNALKDHPTLEGRVDLVIDVAKTGEVSGCRVKRTTLVAGAFPENICTIVRQLKLQPRDAAWTSTKPIDFFPDIRPLSSPAGARATDTTL